MKTGKSRLSERPQTLLTPTTKRRTLALFLGAGASKPFGFPLTREILPNARRQINDGVLFEAFPGGERAARKLGKFLKQLLPAFERQNSELPLITDVLSLVDYSLLVSSTVLRSRTSRELLEFRKLLELALYDILWWPYTVDNVPRLLSQFADALFALGSDPHYRIGVVTTNYDMAVDAELAEHYESDEREQRFDFGFPWRDPGTGMLHEQPQSPHFLFYKLHGSVNWLRCEHCEHVYVNLWGAIGGWGFTDKRSPDNTCHCDHSPLRHLLVAPSLVRDVRDGTLLSIWKRALELLRTADEWVIIGYSFPPEDIAIRSLFLRAFQGRGDRPKVTVVQKGRDRATRARYRLFFPDCTFLTGGLEEYVPRLAARAGTNHRSRNRPRK